MTKSQILQISHYRHNSFLGQRTGYQTLGRRSGGKPRSRDPCTRAVAPRQPRSGRPPIHPVLDITRAATTCAHGSAWPHTLACTRQAPHSLATTRGQPSRWRTGGGCRWRRWPQAALGASGGGGRVTPWTTRTIGSRWAEAGQGAGRGGARPVTHRQEEWRASSGRWIWASPRWSSTGRLGRRQIRAGWVGEGAGDAARRRRRQCGESGELGAL